MSDFILIVPDMMSLEDAETLIRQEADKKNITLKNIRTQATGYMGFKCEMAGEIVE